MGHALEDWQAGYTPAESQNVNASPFMVELTLHRLAAFNHHVTTPQRIRPGTFHQVWVMSVCLQRGNKLYLSISEMFSYGGSAMWLRSRESLKDQFDDLWKRDYLVRSSRDIIRGNGKVLIWGIAPKGKALLREYYQWMGGEHDDKIGF